MKILHLADLHLGKRLLHFDRSQEQRAVLDEIVQIADAHQPDLVLLAGDLYDTFNPPTSAVEDLYRTCKRLTANATRPVVAIAGNHDSPQRIEAPDPLARECGILFAGFPATELPTFELETGLAATRTAPGFIELAIPGLDHPVRILLAPYANEIRMRRALNSDQEMREALRAHWQTTADSYCDPHGVNLLLAHLFMMPRGGAEPEEPEDERPIKIGNAAIVYTDLIPDQVQYAALGHLHRYQNMSGGPCPVVYPSSILSYSFAEAGQQKYAVIVDIEPGGEAEIQKIPLQSGYPLERKEFSDIDEAVQWLVANQDCYVELTLVSDSYIASADRKRITEAHPRIIGPIPKLTGEAQNATQKPLADPTQSLQELFQQYFQYKHGQAPNEEIKSLLDEILQVQSAQ